jgi:hypothetical protein
MRVVPQPLRAVVLLVAVSACGRADTGQASAPGASPQAAASVPLSLPMGGSRSVMSFFITSSGTGRGGDLGGLAGADARCQALAAAEGAGDRMWRAYLSTSAGPGQPAVNARDRIGAGPWYNAEGLLIAATLDDLHGPAMRLTKASALTEKFDMVQGAGDTPNAHDVLTGSRPDGTAYDAADDRTCRNWTSDAMGRAQVGHHDRVGEGEAPASWNSAHASRGCSQRDLESTGGAGLFYCFAAD